MNEIQKIIIKQQRLLIISIILAIGVFALYLTYISLLGEIDQIPTTEVKTPEIESSQAYEGVGDPCTLDVVTCKDPDVFEVSCYTGWESHGVNGRENGVSVATYQFPQGTWLDIEGIGKRRVDTVTATWVSHRVDVWFGDTYEDYERCLDFGIKQLKIKEL